MYLYAAAPRRPAFHAASRDYGFGAITFADLEPEMIGRRFSLASTFTGPASLPPGSIVQVATWPTNSTSVMVTAPPPAKPGLGVFAVLKSQLRPVITPVAGVIPYDVGLDRVLADHARGDGKIKAWEAQRAKFTTPKGKKLFDDELARLQGLQAKRDELLNRRLIQAVMFNRFDDSIKKWTDHYNTEFGFTGTNALDPNIVKSMLFQETQMGTSGKHLEINPAFMPRSRHNIGQVIDSAAAALLIMIQEMEPALIAKHKIGDILKDLEQARKDFAVLKKVARPTPAQKTRLDELQLTADRSKNLGISFAETFMWTYKLPGPPRPFIDAVIELFNNVPVGAPRRHLDYDFWIRVAVRWLFVKRRGTKSWAEAVRAYNGSGPDAERYRDKVLKRATDALSAGKAKRQLVPANI